MNKIILPTLSIFAFLIFTNIDAYACSCFPRGDEPLKQQVNKAKTDSQTVFSGKVLDDYLSVEKFGSKDFATHITLLEIEVLII